MASPRPLTRPLKRINRKKLAGRTVLASLAIAAAVDSTLRASTASVSVSNTSLGTTPQLLGYSMGHYMPASNTSAWLKYSGANAFRYWASADDFEPTDDMAPYGDGVSTQGQFDLRKSALRSNPESSTYINWNYFKNNFANTIEAGRNTATFDYPMAEMQKMGIDVLQQDTRGTNYDYTGWGSASSLGATNRSIVAIPEPQALGVVALAATFCHRRRKSRSSR